MNSESWIVIVALAIIATVVTVAIVAVRKRRSGNYRSEVPEIASYETSDQLDSAVRSLSQKALAYAIYKKLLTVVVTKKRKDSLLERYGSVFVVPSLRDEGLFCLHPEKMSERAVIDKIGIWIRMHGGAPRGEFLHDARMMGRIMVAEAADRANQIVAEAVKDSAE